MPRLPRLRDGGHILDPTATAFAPTTASARGSLIVALAFAYVYVLAAVHLPAHVFDPAGKTFILAVGVIGVWRYAWWSLHAARGLYFRYRVFPPLRRRADALGALARPSEVFVLITSYRIAPEITYRVYDALV